jgi:hypothetical protein
VPHLPTWELYFISSKGTAWAEPCHLLSLILFSFHSSFLYHSGFVRSQKMCWVIKLEHFMLSRTVEFVWQAMSDSEADFNFV